MRKAKQISVSLENKPSRLAHFCGCLADRNIMGLGAKKSYTVIGAANVDAAARALRSKK